MNPCATCGHSEQVHSRDFADGRWACVYERGHPTNECKCGRFVAKPLPVEKAS